MILSRSTTPFIFFLAFASFLRGRVQDGRGFGLLPERSISNKVPWQDVAIDLIGPWRIPINNRTYEFNALTCIDAVMNLTELVGTC